MPKKKPEGVLRKIDSLGRIVIPKGIRDRLDIGVDDMVEIIEDNDSLIIRKYSPHCTYCGGREELREFKGKYLCRICHEELRDI